MYTRKTLFFNFMLLMVWVLGYVPPSTFASWLKLPQVEFTELVGALPPQSVISAHVPTSYYSVPIVWPRKWCNFYQKGYCNHTYQTLWQEPTDSQGYKLKLSECRLVKHAILPRRSSPPRCYIHQDGTYTDHVVGWPIPDLSGMKGEMGEPLLKSGIFPLGG